MQTARKEILRHMMKQIAPYVYLKSLSIPEWTVKSGRHVAPGEFIYDDAPARTMRLGDSWTTTYDETLWLSADLTIPEDYANEKLYLELDFGGEAIVRIDGKIVGGVSSRMNSGWVHRDQIFLPKDVKAGQKLQIEVEATVDSGALCNVILAGGREMTYSLAKACLAAVDPVAESYYFDVMMVYASLDCIRDEAVKARVFAALDDSLHMVAFDFDESQVRASFAPAAELLWDRLGKIRWLPQGEVIMAGHSHIDVAWLWTIREVVRKCARTFSNTIALLDRYPDAVFSQSQAVLYDYVKTYYPEVYAEIKRKIADNQWEVVGNAWVEADTNVAGGEALVRQLLYGKGFFEKEFGISSDIYWLPDCFGFSWALPQIIKKSGMKYFLTSKLNGQDTNRFPHTLFTWRGIDGSEVLAYLQRTPYNGEYEPGKLLAAWENNDQKTIADVSMSMYGYGDGGGGPTLGMVENGRRLAKIPGIPASKAGGAKEFFERVAQFKDEFPVWNDEMYYENHRGTYTSQAFTKKNNRQGEFLLSRSEMACAFAAVFADSEYPAEELEAVWKILLTNQFHDLLPGTSIREAHEDSKKDYAEMHRRGGAVLQNALQKLTESISLPEDSVVCWNFNSWPQTQLVSVTLSNANLVSADEDGKPLPFSVQETKEGACVTFLAKDVPAMGYRAFRLVSAEKAPETGLFVSKDRLENENLRVLLDENGYLTSVYDKVNDREVLSGKGNRLQIFQDKPIHESAWNLELNYQKKGWEPEAERITVSECTPVRAAVRVVRRFNKSVITQDIVLAAGAKRVDFVTHVDWQETEKILKAAFPVAIKSSFASYEIQHGAIARPTHWNTSFDRAKFEACGHKWADLSEGDYGVSLLNDCKYGYDIRDNQMRLTLLKAPICPDTTGDKGEHTFTYSLYPHAHAWQEGGVVAEGFALNEPLRVIAAKKQEGNLPEAHSFVSLNRSHVVIDAIKQAEDGDGLILRVYEAEAKRGTVRVTWNLPMKSVTACNLMEQDEREIPVENGEFSFDITPFSVETFRIRF
ncbi:MAG TPA: alpha-mannosidase [Clostridiales bacterium]|nr:alpha-mannosidase [Clostridiales bacterium]